MVAAITLAMQQRREILQARRRPRQALPLRAAAQPRACPALRTRRAGGLRVGPVARLQEHPLKFAVLFAGVRPRVPEVLHLCTKPLEIKSLHVIGERDKIKRVRAGERAFVHKRMPVHAC